MVHGRMFYKIIQWALRDTVENGQVPKIWGMFNSSSRALTRASAVLLQHRKGL